MFTTTLHHLVRVKHEASGFFLTFDDPVLTCQDTACRVGLGSGYNLVIWASPRFIFHRHTLPLYLTADSFHADFVELFARSKCLVRSSQGRRRASDMDGVRVPHIIISRPGVGRYMRLEN